LSGVNATQTVSGSRDSLSADLANNSFVGSIIWNSSSECHYCLFNLTQLTGANFRNSSLDGSDFTRAHVIYEQLVVTGSLQGIILPNGTIIH
jgi:uncharacterized protein YjbI with pentapeptide repeats